jgi:hypothetical protein
MKRGVKGFDVEEVTAKAGRTKVRMEAPRAAVSIGTAKAVPLSLPAAVVHSTLGYPALQA